MKKNKEMEKIIIKLNGKFVDYKAITKKHVIE